MPTDLDIVEQPADAAPQRRLDPFKGFRLALGVCGLFVIGMAINWPFAFVGAVFAALFLQAPAPPPVKAGIVLIVTSFVLLLFGFALFSLLAPYRGVFVIAVVILLGWAFSLSVSGKSPLLVVLALMMALMMPYLVTVSFDVATALAVWLPLNMGFALLAAWTAFTLFPPDPAAVTQAAQAKASAPKFDPDRRLVRMMLVTLPFVFLFMLLDSGAVLTLLFVAILSQQLAASTGAGPSVAKGMLLANVAGGLMAMVCYELVVIDTRYGFMVVITLLMCLLVAWWFVSGHPTAPLAGSALTTALILFGGAMAPFSDDVDVKMLNRLAQIGAALLWVLAAFLIVDKFLPEREKRPDVPSWRAKRKAERGRARTPKAEAPHA